MGRVKPIWEAFYISHGGTSQLLLWLSTSDRGGERCSLAKGYTSSTLSVLGLLGRPSRSLVTVDEPRHRPRRKGARRRAGMDEPWKGVRWAPSPGAAAL